MRNHAKECLYDPMILASFRDVEYVAKGGHRIGKTWPSTVMRNQRETDRPGETVSPDGLGADSALMGERSDSISEV
jgi:hypothetical protein